MDPEQRDSWTILKGAGIVLIACMGLVLAVIAVAVGLGIGMGLIKF